MPLKRSTRKHPALDITVKSKKMKTLSEAIKAIKAGNKVMVFAVSGRANRTPVKSYTINPVILGNVEEEEIENPGAAFGIGKGTVKACTFFAVNGEHVCKVMENDADMGHGIFLNYEDAVSCIKSSIDNDINAYDAIMRA